MMRSASSKRIGCGAERAFGIGVHRLHDVADEAAVLRPAVGVKPGASSQHQTTTSAAASMSATL